MSRAAVATIDLGALKHNLSIVKKSAPQSKILAVIKANAYGHGLQTVANALSSADGFAVAHYEEAIALRKKIKDKTIVLLQGFADEVELALLLSHSVELVIHSRYQIDILEKFQIPENTTVWLKIDTGMNRLGVNRDAVAESWRRLNSIEKLSGNIKVISHFANADDKHCSITDEQIQLFNQLTKDCNAEKSIANSAGLLHWQTSQLDWVRPGIMLYGVSPFLSETAANHQLKSVMTLKSRIIAINKIKKGESIGYGHIWQASDDKNVAVVGIGYGDGYPRHIKENTPVLINGKYYPIVGRVSMDMLCVDLGNDAEMKVGSDVVLWGDGLPVEKIAAQAGTIAYELLCHVTSRVRFESING